MPDTPVYAGAPTVPAGSRVIMAVSRGPSPTPPAAWAAVPDVAGKSQGDALGQLQQSGLQAQVFNEYSSAVARGKVMGQLPSEGVSAAAGSSVALLVASGPASATAAPVALPDVVGKPEADAREALEAAGLNPQIVRDYSPTVPEGIVLSQLPNQAWLAGLPSKRTSPWIWVAAVVAVLAVVAAAFFFLRGGEKVTVPDVIGETQEEAVAELEDAGLEVEVEDAAEDAEGEEGTVVAEDPGPGTEVDRGSTIRIEVIRPQQPVAVPDVIGLSQAEATAEIEALGLRAATRTETDDSVEPGSVIAQSPRPGAEVSPGSRVSLTIAKATEEPAEVEVPNVSGVSQADAEQTLADLGLEVDVVRNPSEDVAEGTVFAQLPTAGTIVAPGSTVAIVVSSGPPAEEASVSVPDVVGEELPDAQETLAKAGLKSNPVPVPGTEENADDVLGQAPVGGTMVPPGTTITLLYAQ